MPAKRRRIYDSKFEQSKLRLYENLLAESEGNFDASH